MLGSIHCPPAGGAVQPDGEPIERLGRTLRTHPAGGSSGLVVMLRGLLMSDALARWSLRSRVRIPMLAVLLTTVGGVVVGGAAADRAGWPWLAPYVRDHARPADGRHLIGIGLSGGRVTVVNGQAAVRGVRVWIVTDFRRRTRGTQSAGVRLCYLATKAIAAHRYTRRVGTVAVVTRRTTANGLHPVLADTTRFGVCMWSGAMAAVDLR